MRSLFPIVTNNDLVFPDNFVNHFFGDFMKPFDSSYSVPKVDVEDKENEYVLTTDLPGMAKEDKKKTKRKTTSAKNGRVSPSAASSRSAAFRKTIFRHPLPTAC